MNDNFILGNLEGLSVGDDIKKLFENLITNPPSYTSTGHYSPSNSTSDNVFQEEAIREAYEEGLEKGRELAWKDVRTEPPGEEQCEFYQDGWVNLVWTEDSKVFLAYYDDEEGFWFKAFESESVRLRVRKYITIKFPNLIQQ